MSLDALNLLPFRLACGQVHDLSIYLSIIYLSIYLSLTPSFPLDREALRKPAEAGTNTEWDTGTVSYLKE